mmetsp:Transcript_53312/g.159036  ORF Transcript_53312/g.159036 Transcript_53312/m.159036 type:complete len:366 (+) Transcript_53312:507-1604(+)
MRVKHVEFQSATGDEEHLSDIVQLQLLAARQRHLRDRLLADLAQRRRSLTEVDVDHRVNPEDGPVDLTPQLVADVHRELLQDRHLLRSQLLGRGHTLLPHKVPDAGCQAVGYVVVAEEAPDHRVPGDSLSVDVPDVGHSIGDAADKGGEKDEGTHDDTNIEHPLVHVLGEYLHGRWSELCQRPVEAREVSIAEVVVSHVHQVVLHPRGPSLAGKAGDEEPETCYIVVEDDNNHEKPQQPDDLQDILRVDPCHQLRDVFAHLHKSQQSRDSHDARDCLGEPDVALGPAHQDQQAQVDCYDAQVNGEPCLQIVDGNRAHPPLHDARVGDVCRDEGQHHIARPEDGADVVKLGCETVVRQRHRELGLI